MCYFNCWFTSPASVFAVTDSLVSANSPVLANCRHTLQIFHKQDTFTYSAMSAYGAFSFLTFAGSVTGLPVSDRHTTWAGRVCTTINIR